MSKYGWLYVVMWIYGCLNIVMCIYGCKDVDDPMSRYGCLDVLTLEKWMY